MFSHPLLPLRPHLPPPSRLLPSICPPCPAPLSRPCSCQALHPSPPRVARAAIRPPQPVALESDPGMWEGGTCSARPVKCCACQAAGRDGMGRDPWKPTSCPTCSAHRTNAPTHCVHATHPVLPLVGVASLSCLHMAYGHLHCTIVLPHFSLTLVTFAAPLGACSISDSSGYSMCKLHSAMASSAAPPTPAMAPHALDCTGAAVAWELFD